MKSRFVLLTVCLVIAGISLTLLPPSWGSYADQKQTTPDPVSYDAPGMEAVPLYPNATSIVEEKPFREEWAHTTYRANADYQDVANFYKANLPKNGWVINTENSFRDYAIVLLCTWSGNSDTLPFALELHIAVSNMTLTPQAPLADMNTTLIRVPNYRRIPAYPAAQQIVIKNAFIENGQSIGKLTTFLTTASPSEVEAYYKKLLIQYGYRLQEQSQPDKQTSIAFIFYAGGPEAARSSAVLITTRQSPEGLTEVEIRGK